MLLEGLDAGDVGVWSWSAAADRIEWSPNLEAIHGLPPGQFDGTFSFFQTDIHPDDRERVARAIQEAMRAGGAYRVEYRLPPEGDKPPRWLEARGRVTLDGDGKAAGMIGICQDITRRKTAELEVARRARQQEAAVRLGDMALRGHGVERLFDVAVGDVARLLDVEYCKVLEVLPDGRELVVRAGVGWREGTVGAARVSADAATQAGYTLTVDHAVVTENLAQETRFRGHPLLHDHAVVSGITVIVAGDLEKPFGVLGAHTRRQRTFSQGDVDFMQSVANVLANAVQRDRAQERQGLLIRELRHRVGNLISVILSLFHNSVRGARSMEEFADTYEARILALSRSHGLISETGWTTTRLNDLVREVLEPYLDKVECDGAPVDMAADTAFYFALALHELATNAVKYGALSSPAGRIAVRWHMEGEGNDTAIAVDWVEKGGPEIAAPGAEGFGSRLIDALIRRQIRGDIAVDFAPAGLQVRMKVPLNPTEAGTALDPSPS